MKATVRRGLSLGCRENGPASGSGSGSGPGTVEGDRGLGDGRRTSESSANTGHDFTDGFAEVSVNFKDVHTPVQFGFCSGVTGRADALLSLRPSDPQVIGFVARLRGGRHRPLSGGRGRVDRRARTLAASRSALLEEPGA